MTKSTIEAINNFATLKGISYDQAFEAILTAVASFDTTKKTFGSNYVG